MAKKTEPVKELYLVINEREELQEWFRFFSEAQTMISRQELNGAKILKVVQIWESSYPEEPEMEFFETSLEEI